MPDGKVVFETDLDNAKLEKELANLSKKIEKIEQKINDAKSDRAPLVEQAEKLGVRLDAAKAKLYEMQTASKGVFSAEQTRSQKEEVNRLQKSWNEVQSQVEKYDKQIASATRDLDRQKKRAGQITEQLSQAASSTGVLDDEMGEASKRLDKLSGRISKLVSRALFFSLISKGLSSLREWMSDVISTNDEASAAVARLKGALLTMAQPLVDVIIPAFTTFINLLTAIVGKIAAFLSALGGKTVQQSANAAKALNKQTNALNGVGSAAKEAKKQLMGFDEINQLSDTDSSSGGSGVSSEIQPDFSWADSVSETLDKIADYILLIAAGFALWKIGSLLPGTLGTILSTLGLLLVAIGSLLIMWDGLKDAWENGVDWGNLTEMVLGLAVAAGALYAAFGPIAAGIVLIVGGLALLVTGFHDAMESGWNLQNTLLTIAGIMAAGLGVSLLIGSWIPLLIAAIASVLLAMTVATGHGEELIQGIKDICQGFVDFFTGIFTGDLEKALGGVEKIFTGLGSAVEAVISGVRDTILSFLDWLDEKTGGKLHGVIEFAKSLVSSFFDGIKNMVSGAIEGIKQIFTGLVQFVSGVFTGDWDLAWEGVKNIFKGIWNGIAALLEGGVNLIINGVNWLIGQLNKINFTLPDWIPGVGGMNVGINIPTISQISIPRLAQGAVIPPNREFMAVLGDQKHGTNIEAPLETIQEAVSNVLSKGNYGGTNDQQIVDLLQAILEAVLDIELDGEALSNAVHDFDRKKAVSVGG